MMCMLGWRAVRERRVYIGWQRREIEMGWVG